MSSRYVMVLEESETVAKVSELCRKDACEKSPVNLNHLWSVTEESGTEITGRSGSTGH